MASTTDKTGPEPKCADCGHGTLAHNAIGGACTKCDCGHFRPLPAQGTEGADMSHERETTTPMDDGTLLADCSCGASYSVPQGGNEYAALEEAHSRHVAEAKAA